MFVFVSARISDISAGEYLKYPKYHSLLVGKKKKKFFTYIFGSKLLFDIQKVKQIPRLLNSPLEYK